MATGGPPPGYDAFNKCRHFWADQFELFFRTTVAPAPAVTLTITPPPSQMDVNQPICIMYRSESPHPAAVPAASPNIGRTTPTPMVEVGGAHSKPKPS